MDNLSLVLVNVKISLVCRIKQMVLVSLTAIYGLTVSLVCN